MNASQGLEVNEELVVDGDLDRLQESFRVFTEKTAELEGAYDRLTKRATRVDLELRRANRELAGKVDALESSGDVRRRMLDALPSGVVVVDETGAVVTVNPAAERLLGRHGSEIVGRSRAAIVGATGDDLLFGGTDASHPEEREVTAMDGARRRLGSARVALGDGCEMHVLSDHTVLSRLRQQVGRLDVLASMGEMAASIAHEIRNPLNGVDGFAALLQRRLDEDASPEMHRYAGKIREGVRELDAIVTNLLAFASPGRLHCERIDLIALIDDMEECAPSFLGADESLEVAVEIAADVESRHLNADSVKIRMVLRNLVKNAVEAIKPSGRILIRADKIGDRCRLSVEDNGPGVPRDMIDRLFRPFATSKAKGTGLGLAIAKKIVDLHDGELEYKRLPVGSAFTFTLALAEEIELT